MSENETIPVDNSTTNSTKKSVTFDQNELRAMAGGVALIIIILLILKNDGTGNYNNIIFILIGFFVGGSLLTSRNVGE